MINDILQKIDYEDINKIYIPKDKYNENWNYRLNGDNITIVTNKNCRSQNMQRYCTCYRYNPKYNIGTNGYECNVTTDQNYEISKEFITQDVNDSIRITEEYKNQYIIKYGIVIIALIFVLLMKKNSRRI